MSKLFVLLSSVIILGSILGIVRFGTYSAPNPAIISTDDLTIKAVLTFWNNALTEKDIDDLITIVPSEFLDENERCLKEQKTKIKGDDEHPVAIADAESEFSRGLKQTASSIRKGSFEIVKIKILRQAENEAIVDVDYSKTHELNFTEKRYFFLIRINNDWKIFMDTATPVLFNKQFAKMDCPPNH